MVEHREPGAERAGREALPSEQGPPSWWSGREVLMRLSAETRPVAEVLQSRLFPDTEATAAALPPTARLDDLWQAVGALREAILEGRDRGATAEEMDRLHRRLDAAAETLSHRFYRRTVAETRKLVQDVSHDIRSPLNSILFLADTLFHQHAGQLNDVQRRQVGVLYTAAVTLVGLVNDLIDAGRLGEGEEIPVAHVSFSLEAVLNDVESLLAPLADHREVELRFQLETLGPRTGDRQLLSRVLLNLVTNAIQAAEDGGRVEVRATEPVRGTLRVEVQDDGEDTDHARLRGLLEDVSPVFPTRRREGWTHGLGLAISSRLVRAAGGSIRVADASKPDASETGDSERGTTFTVELPFPRA